MSPMSLHGLTLRDCAQIQAKDGALRAEHGDKKGRVLHTVYLGERGLSESQWAQAWNAWWEKMQGDASGQLQASFAQHQREAHLQAHHGDVPDASQQPLEGVSLERFAEVSARAAAGEDMQTLVAEVGISWAQWQRASAAWHKAMGEDHSHRLTTQYGQLYGKYSPGFEQRLRGQTAAMAAGLAAAPEQPEEEEAEYTFEQARAELRADHPETRWRAAHHVFTAWDIGERGDGDLDEAATTALAVALECLSDFDKGTVSNAEAMVCDLCTLAEQGFLDAPQAARVHSVLSQAMDRAKAALAEQEQLLAPIRDQAVPERVFIQSAIQDLSSLVEELSTALEEWEDQLRVPAPAAPAAPAPRTGPAPAQRGAAPTPARELKPAETGLLATLKQLPVLGDLLRALGL